MTTKLEELSTRLGTLSNESASMPCPYARMVDHFMEDDEEVGMLLSGIIYDHQVPVRRIHIEVKRFGYSIGHESLSLHRAGDCSCSPREKA